MIREQIEKKITKKFNPIYLKVEDESLRHKVPIGSESHFKVVLVTDQFINYNILDRHRAVYAVLSDELSSSIHALTLRIYTTDEWKKSNIN